MRTVRSRPRKRSKSTPALPLPRAESHDVIVERRGRSESTAYKSPGRNGSGATPFLRGETKRTDVRFHEHVFHDFLLPRGYPESVTPRYAPYMAWRGVQYFFGGAISVFTTQALIQSVGVSAGQAAASSAALRWVVKDGAGRAGRFVFARWGKELDGELKQYRLVGDLLMEAGACLELATASAPRAFLPLACLANLSKNVAAVAMSATRAPIYRSFARNNNMADITAKGESVANIADLAGTVAGLLFSRSRLPAHVVFAVLSAGYLTSSRYEVDAVALPYYNGARLALAARTFFATGNVLSPDEVNRDEPLVPWADHGQHRVVLGSSLDEAFCNWGATNAEVQRSIDVHRDDPFILAARPGRRLARVHAVLKEGATREDVTEAAFLGHLVLHRLEGGATEPGTNGAAGPGPASLRASSGGRRSARPAIDGGDNDGEGGSHRRRRGGRLPAFLEALTGRVPGETARLRRRLAPGMHQSGDCWNKAAPTQAEIDAALTWALAQRRRYFRRFRDLSLARGWEMGNATSLNTKDIRVRILN